METIERTGRFPCGGYFSRHTVTIRMVTGRRRDVWCDGSVRGAVTRHRLVRLRRVRRFAVNLRWQGGVIVSLVEGIGLQTASNSATT